MEDSKLTAHDIEMGFDREQINKADIYKLLESVLDMPTSDRVLVDIVFEEDQKGVIVLGRPPVIGSSTKQMRHITPYSFVEQLVKIKVKSAKIIQDVFNNFITDLKWFVSKEKGICLTDENDYKALKLLSMSEFVDYSYLKTTQQEYYLINEINLPNNWESIFNQDKCKLALDLYQAKKQKLIKHVMGILEEVIIDNNTYNIACEALSRFMFTLFNQRQLVAFPDEGNTLNYDIRLYKSKADIIKSHSAFASLKSHELNKFNLESLDSKIRIVCNEGDVVKKVVKSLKILHDILVIYSPQYIIDDIEELILKYNEYKLYLKPSNHITQMEVFNYYNCDLALEKDFLIQVNCQIAKQLYIAFDFKPLEDIVFVPSNTSQEVVHVYSSAQGIKRQSKYSLISGKDYRNEQENSAKGYNDEVTFRSEVEGNFRLLGKKIIEHLTIGLLPFNSFTENDKFLNQILENFVTLVIADYQIQKEELNLNEQIINTLFDYTTDYSSDTSSVIEEYYKGIDFSFVDS